MPVKCVLGGELLSRLAIALDANWDIGLGVSPFNNLHFTEHSRIC